MAATLKEEDLLIVRKDADGNPVIRMPITRVENVEGGIKTINGIEPDANKNVNVDVGVKSVNGQTGDITISNGITLRKWG